MIGPTVFAAPVRLTVICPASAAGTGSAAGLTLIVNSRSPVPDIGDTGALDAQGLLFAAGAATATLISLALFIRGFLAEGADPVFMRAARAPGWALHMLLMMLVALNLVAGFRAFGALMTVGLMMIPAAAARFWAHGYLGQAGAAVLISATSSALGLILARALSAAACRAKPSATRPGPASRTSGPLNSSTVS